MGSLLFLGVYTMTKESAFVMVIWHSLPLGLCLLDAIIISNVSLDRSSNTSTCNGSGTSIRTYNKPKDKLVKWLVGIHLDSLVAWALFDSTRGFNFVGTPEGTLFHNHKDNHMYEPHAYTGIEEGQYT